MNSHANTPEALRAASTPRHCMDIFCNTVDSQAVTNPHQDPAKVDDHCALADGHYDSTQHAPCCSCPATRPATPLSQSPQLYSRAFIPGAPSSQAELEEELNTLLNNSTKQTYHQVILNHFLSMIWADFRLI
jgi:hypothetical protein